ncbi:hypothetical protein VC116059_001379A, partial [Vibrio cholerae O1 str. 116059]
METRFGAGGGGSLI